MNEQKRSCENCGNLRCANGIIAFWWDECVRTNFEKHWKPKEEKMKKLWKIRWDTGYGYLNGLFLATDIEVKSLTGKVLYIYEQNGKHSEIEWTVEDGEIELFSDDEYVISHVKPFGYNPFEFLPDEE